MSIIDRLNSGEIHAAARKRNPERVDAKGNTHVTSERARFVEWVDRMRAVYGDDVKAWPSAPRTEYARRYVPSH